MRMKPRPVMAISAAALLVSACASGPDHFYSLQPVPTPAGEPRQHFDAEARIRITVPSVMDRNQIVLDRGSTIQVLEHERWAAPLSDQLMTALGQDLEQRRPDVLVTSRTLSQGTGLPRFAIQVEVVALSMRIGSAVKMEVRWQIESSGERSANSAGRETFSAVPADSTASALAVALSQCLADLAGRLAPGLGPRQLSPDS